MQWYITLSILASFFCIIFQTDSNTLLYLITGALAIVFREWLIATNRRSTNGACSTCTMHAISLKILGWFLSGYGLLLMIGNLF